MAVSEPAPDESLPPGPLLRLIRDQRVAYLLVGGFNTANAFFIFVVAQFFLGDDFRGYMASLAVAHVIGVLCAFTLHRRFVFRVQGHLWLDLARFEVVNLGALGMNVVLLPLLVEYVGLPVIPAQCLATVISIGSTYVAHKFFSFRRPAPPTEVADPAPSVSEEHA